MKLRRNTHIPSSPKDPVASSQRRIGSKSALRPRKQSRLAIARRSEEQRFGGAAGYGFSANTVPSPYVPPADVVPYSVPFTSIKPASGVAPSEP